jgi:hypothetical protein
MCWGFNGGSFLTPTPTVGTITPPVLSPGLFATQMSALEGSMVFIGGGSTQPIGIIGAAATCTYGGTGTFAPATRVFGGMEAAQGDFACAILANGSADCWGANDDGELGDGTTTTRFAPVATLPW